MPQAIGRICFLPIPQPADRFFLAARRSPRKVDSIFVHRGTVLEPGRDLIEVPESERHAGLHIAVGRRDLAVSCPPCAGDWSPPGLGIFPIGNRLINARSETLLEKSAFKESFRNRRCLIPADGFYEWLRHEAACVIVRRVSPDRTCHPIGSTLRGMAVRKRIV